MARKPKKPQETVVFTFRLPKAMLETIREDARQERRTIAGQIIHKLLSFYND